MGLTMEPEDILLFEKMPNYTTPNATFLCSSFTRLRSPGIFYSANPLDYMFPVLCFQMTLASGAILLTISLLKPLGMPIMLAQILGGIIVGPSFLCRIPGLFNAIFPLRSFLPLDVLSAIGYMFYFFLIGVQTDILILKKINRKSFAIGVFTVAVPLILTIGSSIFLEHYVDANGKKMDALPQLATAESVLSFPVLAYYLSELKIINSDFGRVALCSSMVSSLCGFWLILLNVLRHQLGDHMLLFLRTVGYGVAFAALIFCIFGPSLIWLMKRNLVGYHLKETNFIVLFLAVSISGIWGRFLGLHLYLGPFLFGLIVPSGTPLGSALVEQLDLITYWILMPLHFVKFGLTIDIFAISIKTYSTVQFIALLGACGKFLGASLSALSCQMPLRDAVSLGLVMNFQGILELGLYKFMKNAGVIDAECFSAMCASLLIVTGVITLMVRNFCDPTKRYIVYHGRTVMDSKPNSELRVLVCIHDEENVPSAINLLEALNPSSESPISVYMLHLVELTGSSTPLLIPLKTTRRLSSRASGSGPVINAFRIFEENHVGLLSIFPFIAVSPPQIMHNDVYAIALENGTSLVIIPFHKRFHVNGALESHKKAIRIANQNVLDKAPCSVAILVDRGPLKTLSALWSCWSSYEVAVIFLGGADDREALALGARMAGLSNINLTLIRILYDEKFPDSDTEGSKLDNEVINEFKTNISGNFFGMYIEELVTDGAGTASVLRMIENRYELVVVGRRYDDESPILSGLREWNENRELGVIGDMLASSDFLGSTTILVVQQHTDDSEGN